MEKILKKFMKTLVFALVMVLGFGPVASTYAETSQSQNSTTVRIYYDREDIDDWSVHLWADGVDGADYHFNGKDEKGNYAEITLDKTLTSVNYIIKKGDWVDREPSDKEDGSRTLTLVDNYGEAFVKQNVEENKKDDTEIPKEKEDKDNKNQDEKTLSLTIHYDNKEEGWSLWLWPKDGEGKDYNFTGEDEHGKYAEIDLKTNQTSIGFLVKDKNWNKDIGDDRFIDIFQGTEIWLKSKDPNIYYENPYEESKTHDKLNAVINYRRYDMTNDDIWAIQYWNNQDDKDIKTQKLEKDGKYYKANIISEDSEINKLFFNVVKLDSEGNVIYKDGQAREIKKFDEAGKAEVYLMQDVQRVFYDKTLVEEDLKVEKVNIDSFREINIKLNKPINIEEMLENDYDFITDSDLTKDDIEKISAKDTSGVGKEINIKFKKDLDLDKDYEFKFYLDKDKKLKLDATAVLAGVVADKKFDEKFAYDGELGVIYSKENTEFKLWAPTASKVDLVIFGNDGEKKIPMQRNDKGVYSYTLEGDQDKTLYMYDVHFKDGSVNRVVDPYAKSTTINGEKSVVVNPEVSLVERPKNKYVKNPIIYELHVRDLSNQKYSGIKNRGKFLGLTEEGTQTPNGFKTGLDYIADLGVSHIQLLPIYDFSKYSVDEKNPMDKFNWGYDPVNYNTPEGAYSTNPNDPYNRIEELQEAIDAVHKKDMGVIMDVVYNHVYSLGEHSFNKIVPGYYFRFDENGNPHNGTGVGNEIASERKMMSKFIVDSVKYWAKTYKLDGFRFDLMGILDYETMNKLARELKEINPDIVLLGEGWNMGNLPEDKRATQINSNKMPNIGTFNDDLRDGVKGSAFGGNATGFVNGEENIEEKLFSSIKTVQKINGKNYDNPQQLIQYTEAHDNKTVFDKIKEIHPNEDDATTLKRQRLATAIPLLSQGRPFIHAGQEFARTKDGNENSYNASAELNELDWKRAEEYKDNIEYIKEVIAIRKAEPLFNLNTFDQVEKVVNKIVAKDGLIAYSMIDREKEIYIGHNRDNNMKEFNLANGKYEILIKDDKANHEGLGTIIVKDGKIEVDPMSTIMVRRIIEDEKPSEDEKADPIWEKKINELINKIDDLKLSSNEKANLASQLYRLKDNSDKITEEVYNKAKEIFDAKVKEIEKNNGGSSIAETSKEPTVDSIYKDSSKISGTGVPGAKIEIYYGASENDLALLPISIIVGEDGKWSVDKPSFVGVGEGYILSIVQKEEGKKPSVIKTKLEKGKAGEKEKPEQPSEPKEQEYLLIFNGNAGSPASQRAKVKDGENIVGIKNPTREGYKFVKWVILGTDKAFDINEKFSKDILSKGDNRLMLVAVWEKNKPEQPSEPKEQEYLLIFNGNAGSPASQRAEVKDGEKIEGIKEPTRDGYKFVKWVILGTDKTFELNNKFSKNVLSKDDNSLMLVAVWEKVEKDPKPGKGSEEKPGTKPGKESEEKPSTKPGKDSETKPGKDLETKPDPKPGKDSDKKPETKPEKPKKDSWYWLNYHRLFGGLGTTQSKESKKTFTVKKYQYDRLIKAYRDNKTMVEAAKFLLENCPKTVRPVKAKLEKQVRDAEKILKKTEKILEKIDESGVIIK